MPRSALRLHSHSLSGSGHITSVAFSENGYSIAAACGGAASIFDLRKLAKSQVIAALVTAALCDQ
jgi:hypothetical protein